MAENNKYLLPHSFCGLAWWLSGKESTCNAGDTGDAFALWVRKSPWRRKWQPTPVFLPEKSHRQRSLEGCSLWGFKESDMTEHAHMYSFVDLEPRRVLTGWLWSRVSLRLQSVKLLVRTTVISRLDQV